MPDTPNDGAPNGTPDVITGTDHLAATRVQLVARRAKLKRQLRALVAELESVDRELDGMQRWEAS
jgi:hypothetical protein